VYVVPLVTQPNFTYVRAPLGTPTCAPHRMSYNQSIVPPNTNVTIYLTSTPVMDFLDVNSSECT
jgi:hypothetical protein